MKIDFAPDRTLYPFESRWFDSSAGRMHYIDEGSGTPILFCHGNPTWSFLYRGIVARLRDRFRCIAVDYLGFGLSEHPDSYGYTIEEHARTTGELVDHLGLDGFIVMGQDWGGPVSMAVATQRADRVSGVILGNTWFWPPTVPFRLFSRFMGTRLMQRKIIHDNFFVEQIMPISSAKKLSELEKEHYRAVQPSPAARRGVAMMPKQIVDATPLLERLSHDVPNKLGSKPALITWGMKDIGFRPAMIKHMRASFSDARVLELSHAKHYIQEDAPAAIAEAIVERYG
ncbi:MAG: alpha/beta fold hydrolase [Chloroflexi bacterium]|nr:alpha/beta fold hydrolase [Chloroflexota bacterium]